LDLLSRAPWIPGKYYSTKVIMVIKAPKGKCHIVEADSEKRLDTQCKAVQAFMEEHKNG